MAYSKEEAVERARVDLAERLGVPAEEIKENGVEDAEFPDMALGAAAKGEMSGMMITTGWRISLSAAGKKYEYRANRNQVRLYKFKGANYKL